MFGVFSFGFRFGMTLLVSTDMDDLEKALSSFVRVADACEISRNTESLTSKDSLSLGATTMDERTFSSQLGFGRLGGNDLLK